MSQSGALSQANQLRTALLDHGVRSVSIELQQGRPGTPNGSWYDTRFVGSCGHHTVSRPSNGNTPVLSLVKRGRPDVQGPLCNGYGGYDRVARLICMGWANHPGAGGPLRVGRYTIPRDQARPYLFGWEMEGGLEPWSDEMHDFMARCFAGTLDWIGTNVECHVEHKTWAPDRKIDRLNYTLARARERISAVWSSNGVEDELSEKDVAELKKHFDTRIADVAKAAWGYEILNPVPGPDRAPAASLLRVSADRAHTAADEAAQAGGKVWSASVDNPLDDDKTKTNPLGLLRAATDHAVQASLASREMLGILREIRDHLLGGPPAETAGEDPDSGG
jgi:hypothetical protein